MSLSFAHIIDTISEDQMINLINSNPALSSNQLIENNKQSLSPDSQKLYLAFYAKAAYEHVGFSGFSEDNQAKFKSTIEKLYSEIQEEIPQGEFLKKMTSSTAKYVEDRHFTVGIGENTIHGGIEREDRTVGKNFSYRTDEEKPKDYKVQGSAQGKTGEGEKFPIWEIGTMQKNGEDLMVVSIYDIAHRGNDYDAWKDFIEKFDELYLQNKEKWDKGRIILDVRGNRGGEDKPIDHIAKRLYGNMVNTYKRCEIKDSKLSNHILHKHGAYKPNNYEKDGLSHDHLVQRKHFSGEKKVLFDETETFYPFDKNKGYNGRLDILLCARVGSSAESAYTSFYFHPNVRYIGENTHGMQQYTQGTFTSPWGGEMRIGATKLTYYDKEGENVEVKGHKPDINCSGKDAFDVALSLDKDEGRVKGRRETNEKITGKETYVDYDPKAPSDPRKAYYAKYIDPAIASIEHQNITKKHLARMRKRLTQDNVETVNRNIANLRGLSTSVNAPYKPKKIDVDILSLNYSKSLSK